MAVAGIIRQVMSGDLPATVLLDAAVRVLCAHCGTMQRIVTVSESAAGTNPWTGEPDEFIPIQLADGGWARLWKTEPPE